MGRIFRAQAFCLKIYIVVFCFYDQPNLANLALNKKNEKN